MLPSYFDNTPARAVDNSFGRGFAKSLDALPLNDWQGPVESGLGLHLVKIAERVEGYLPDLADIRPIVEREWVNENRLETRRLINDQLLSNYDVVIEWPTE
jgi:parvulin-like peptidyl-prolyl isomerase